MRRLDERSPFHPRSPSAWRSYGYFITLNYRESFGILCHNGILFNMSRRVCLDS